MPTLHIPSLVALPLFCASCNAPPPEPAGCSHEIRWYVPQNATSTIDLLFVVDDSSGMGPAQARMKAGLPILLDALAHEVNRFVDLHIGVITTDMGAGATGAPGCAVAPGPRGGRFQRRGAAAAPGCQPPVGRDFIEYQFWENHHGPNNLPPGQDLQTTLACMLSVGESGCAFPQPIAAARAALADRDFLREESDLVLVFLTNHDDGSAPLDTDLFDATKTARYGHLDRYARQTRAGVLCGNPSVLPPYGASAGPLADCTPAPNPGGRDPGRLDDIDTLGDLLGKPATEGGLKYHPVAIHVATFAGPVDPFEVVLTDPDAPADAPIVECTPLSESPPLCLPRLRPSCRGADPHLVAEPAVRLAALTRDPRRRGDVFASICDTDYATLLARQFFRQQFCLSCGGSCALGPLAPDPLSPDCHVEDVTLQRDGSERIVSLDRCVDGDPRGEDAPPCWRAERSDTCASLSPDRVRLWVDRHGRPAPPHTVSRFSCATTC